MRIGIVPSLDPYTGGIYQYSLTFLRVLHEQAKLSCNDEFIIYASKLPDYLGSSDQMKWTLVSEPPRRRPLLRERLRDVIGEGSHLDGLRWHRRQLNKRFRPAAPTDVYPDAISTRDDLREFFHQWGTELMLYPALTPNSLEAGLPYVMAIRRDALFQVGGFNSDLVGDFFLGDGETGLNHKLWERGMLVGYVPEAIIYHHIPPQKMTVKFFRHRMASEGAADVYMRFHYGIPRWFRLWKHAAEFQSGMVNLDCRPFSEGRTDARSLRSQLHAARTQSQLVNA